MKVLLVALVAVFAAYADEVPPPDYILHGTCGTPDAPNPAPLGKVIRQTKEFFETVFEGHCDVEGGSFIEYFMAQETECLDLFLQSYCYTQLASSRTDPVWGLTFEQLNKEIPDIGGVTELWCNNKCSEKLLPYVWRCYTDPVIKPFVVKKISDQFDWAKGEVAKYEDILAGSPIGRIITVGLANWHTWLDVGKSIKVNRPAILKMFGDLRYNFADFCEAKCYVPAFKYAGDLVKSLARGGCDRPRWFCGECQANAHEFVDAPENEIPCCFQRMFDWVLSRTDAGVAASKGIGNAYLLSDVAVLSSTNEDFQCWREVLEPAVFVPGIIWKAKTPHTLQAHLPDTELSDTPVSLMSTCFSNTRPNSGIEPHQSTTKIPTVTLKQRAQTTEPPRRRKVKWGDDLPQDFFERMDYFAQSSMVRHQDLIQKIRFEVQRQTEEALATQHRLSRDQVQSADSGITEDVSLPAIFMPSKNGVVFSPKARKYFHPPGSREPRLSQPPSVFRLPNMGSTPVLNLFDLSQKNVVQKGPGWLYKTCKDVTKR